MVPARDWSHRTVLAAERESASRARDFVGEHLAEHDELLHLVEDVRLVVTELALTALSWSPAPFAVILTRWNGSVRLTVECECPFGPLDGDPDPLVAGGRRLMLLELLSTD